MGLLGSSFSSVAKRVFDRFNRVNQVGLGFTEDQTQWDIIRPGFNIVSQKAEATNTDYPMAVVPFSGDVVISLSGISQGSSAALWVSDADNWWAIGIDQEPIECNCQTGTNCVANNSATCNPTDFPISCTEYVAAWTVPTAWRYNSGQPPTAWGRNASTCAASSWNAGTCIRFSGGTCGGYSGGNCSTWNSGGCVVFGGRNAATWNQGFCRASAPTNCAASVGGNCSSWNSSICVVWTGGSCAANNSSNCAAFTGGNCASSSCASSSCASFRCNRFSRGRCVSTSCASNRCNSWRCNSFNARNCSRFNTTSCSRWNSRNCAASAGQTCRTFNSTFCVVFSGGGCTAWNARNVATWNASNCEVPGSRTCSSWNATTCVSYVPTTCIVRTGNNSTCNSWALGTSYATRWTEQTSFVSATETRYASVNAVPSSANCIVRPAYTTCCTAQSSFNDCQGQISTWNSTSCRTWESFQFGCQTCYPQYIRILQSAGSVVSEVFSWTVNSIINSLRIKTRGDEVTISAYSDENLTTQIGSDIVYTPTGVTVHPSYGITIQPSGQNQGFSFDTFEITRN